MSCLELLVIPVNVQLEKPMIIILSMLRAPLIADLYYALTIAIVWEPKGNSNQC